MKDQRLELAEAYYAVARDLEYNAQEFARVAGLLNHRADSICEQGIADDAAAERAKEPRSFGDFKCGACGGNVKEVGPGEWQHTCTPNVVEGASGIKAAP